MKNIKKYTKNQRAFDNPKNQYRPTKMKNKDFVLSPVVVNGKKIYLKRHYASVWFHAILSFSVRLSRKLTGFQIMSENEKLPPLKARIPLLDMNTSVDTLKKLDKRLFQEKHK